MIDAKSHRSTRQQEADILLRHYQSRRDERHRNRPADGPTIIAELRELQKRINELVVKYHAGA